LPELRRDREANVRFGRRRRQPSTPPAEYPGWLRSLEVYLIEHGESSATVPIGSPQRHEWIRRQADDFTAWCESNGIDDRQARAVLHDLMGDQFATRFALDPLWWDRLAIDWEGER
jgi:hypothetical protein